MDIADRMESVCLPKEQIEAWKAHIEAADKKMSFDDFKKPLKTPRRKVSDLRKLTSRRVRLRLRSRKLPSRGIQLTLKAD